MRPAEPTASAAYAPSDYVRAVLNILEDFGGEKVRLQETQKAVLNILDDFGDEKERFASIQKAVLNILEDFTDEKQRLEDMQRAVLNVLDDLDEEKKALAKAVSDLKQSNNELEQFAYVASHDLQEPLRMVSSYTQLLAQRYQGQIDEKADKYIAYAVDGARRMHQLIGDLLTYSRVGTRGKAATETTESSAVFDDVRRNLQAVIDERHAVVTSDVLPVVRADGSQLLHVLQNLVANAIKFNQSVPPRVHVSAHEEKGEWLFAVSDNGIGIDSRYAEKLFIIFQRLHTREGYPGSGIGLAVCKRIVERQGGRIWFKSVPQRGSTFFFTVPK